ALLRELGDPKHDVETKTEALSDARNEELFQANGPRTKPDPDGMNDKRATWAGKSISAFQDATGTDHEDALADLLTDLMHWTDRTGLDFDQALERARWHYEAETEELGEEQGFSEATKQNVEGGITEKDETQAEAEKECLRQVPNSGVEPPKHR